MGNGDSLQELHAVDDALSATDALADLELFQQIVNALPDAFLIVNSAGRIVMVNQQLELLFGYARSRLLGEQFDMLIPPGVRERHSKHFASYFDYPTRRPMNMAQTLTGLRSDGKTISVQIVLGPLVSKRGTLALALIRRVTTNAPA